LGREIPVGYHTHYKISHRLDFQIGIRNISSFIRKKERLEENNFLPPKEKKLHPSVWRNGALENQQLGGIAKVPCIAPSYLNLFHFVKGKCRR
jgi:hypothetical protein